MIPISGYCYRYVKTGMLVTITEPEMNPHIYTYKPRTARAFYSRPNCHLAPAELLIDHDDLIPASSLEMALLSIDHYDHD